ncbi:Rpb4/RPC9 family DNA-directed RNA polymerase subunit ASCRUDRAFT_19267, partial [Ascoidea rubescens DSM 1968]
RDKFLSNFEVFQHIEDIKAENEWDFASNDTLNSNKRYTKRYNGNSNLESLAKNLTDYFQKFDTTTKLNEQKLKSILLHLNNYHLEKIEKLQIINFLPTSVVHLYSLVEECDLRFTDDQCDTIINKINQVL